MAQAAKELERVVRDMNNMSDKWTVRLQAMEDLDKLVSEGVHYDGFAKLMVENQGPLADALDKQISDLRSELVKQASVSIVKIVMEMGQAFSRFATKLLPTVIEVAGATNGVIRGYGQRTAPVLVEKCHSRNMLFTILDALNNTKSKVTRENCMDYLRIALAFWPIRDLYASSADTIEAAIKFGLGCPTPETRKRACQSFWLFVGHFG
jgi:hypothetical protein